MRPADFDYAEDGMVRSSAVQRCFVLSTTTFDRLVFSLRFLEAKTGRRWSLDQVLSGIVGAYADAAADSTSYGLTEDDQ